MITWPVGRRRFLDWIARLIFCWLACIAAAGAAGLEIPGATSLVVDQTGALTTEQRDTLLARLKALQDAGRAQVAILVSKGTGDLTLAEYALRVAEAWKLGRADRDDGLLVLIVPSVNGARIEVGYGLEGVIPDARAAQWLDDLVPAIKSGDLAGGLSRLLDRIEAVLPPGKTATKERRTIFDEHEEYGPAFALLIFSVFAIFPMFFGRWGSIPAALMLAVMWGGAAWVFWDSSTAGYTAAAVALPLPLLWGLNSLDEFSLPAPLRYAKVVGNFFAVAVFFGIISLFVGVGLDAVGEPLWPGFLFSGMLATGLAVFLFPGKPAHYLMLVLRSGMHFVFVLVLAYVALIPLNPHPLQPALFAAGLVTGLAALALFLESREKLGWRAFGGRRISLVFYALAALVALPFGLLALFFSVGGEDATMQVAQLATGGGSIAGIVMLAARVGLIAAVKVGLGGRFGGGGAGRSD